MALWRFGGQTAIKLTKILPEKAGVPILGTPADSIDMAEDRERFDELLEQLGVKRPQGMTVMTTEEALAAAEKIGYPVLMRPSYVLGGQNMIIAFGEEDIREYMAVILCPQGSKTRCSSTNIFRAPSWKSTPSATARTSSSPASWSTSSGRAFIRGDSIAVYPAWNIDDDMTDAIVDCSRRLALALHTKGLLNIQYLIYEGQLYVIEVNPRSSRTIPTSARSPACRWSTWPRAPCWGKPPGHGLWHGALSERRLCGRSRCRSSPLKS